MHKKAAHRVGGFQAAKYSRSEELFVFRSFVLTCQSGSSHSRIGICFPWLGTERGGRY